jgi:hypothetical protein
MEVYELFIEEDSLDSGIQAISIVENPAIEENFVALKAEKVELAEVDKEKRILMGPALIPNKKIYRRGVDDEEYYIFFSEETVVKASQLFLSRGNQNNSTLEHEYNIKGMSVVESWIVEDEKKDKSALYNLNMPKGTWMVSVKVNNDEIWEEFVKTGKVKGFSIEGYFTDNADRPKEQVEEDLSADEISELEDFSLLLEALESLSPESLAKTYSDYPQAARNNAKRALKWAQENGWGSCGTAVGKQRANQLASGEALTASTIARMASFKRHQQNKDVPYSEGCGGLMWDAWGGSAGVNWAISKMKEING